MLRIALSQRVEVMPDRGERRDCLDQAWTTLLSDCGWLPIPLPNLLRDPAAVLRELRIDGVILTGGNDLAAAPGAVNAAPERDRLEAALLDACGAGSTPVLGVCRGMQEMVVHYGGEVEPVRGHVATRHPVHVAPESPLPLASRAEVNSFHGFGVRRHQLGDRLIAAAWAADDTVEAVAHRSHRQWGVMWHPERAPQDRGDVELMRALFARGRE